MKPRFQPPFPYFGGKSRAAALIWERFGDVRNYVEPFAGSAAVLLNRPHWPFENGHRIETINDVDCFLANFWRALNSDPDAVATHADWPVNEADLHARHAWLMNVGKEHVQRMKTDPDWFDAKLAGWWVWGISQWIGSGWCVALANKRPLLLKGGAGVHRPSHQLPHLGNAGRGVHRPSHKLPHLGDAGRGVHRPSHKLPHLGDAGRGVHRPSHKRPHLGDAGRGGLQNYLGEIARRLRGVRVCCGDWSRVCGPTPTTTMGVTAVFLDPPYADTARRDPNLYSEDSLSVAHDVRKWAIEHGDDPKMKICLAGYEGEHVMPKHWTVVPWKAKGGYASQGVGPNVNATRERLWFSPHCLQVDIATATPTRKVKVAA